VSDIEIQFRADTMEVRHYALREGELPLGWHRGFTQDDFDDGWRAVQAIPASSEAAVEQAKAEHVEFVKNYWHKLNQECTHSRVISEGEHYVMHPAGKGTGFGGRLFLVKWHDQGRAPVVCNLSAQGTVPAWMKMAMPNSASIIRLELLYEQLRLTYKRRFLPLQVLRKDAKNLQFQTML
jgi:hypothetical protein